MRRVCAQPSAWTFSILPIREWIDAHVSGADSIVDPFAGQSTIGTERNDLGQGGEDAPVWLARLSDAGRVFDVALFDPPYSPRQMAEVYASVGRTGMDISQNARLYSACGREMARIVRPGGKCLRFGWCSSAPSPDDWILRDMLVVCHGGAHNDTICTAWERRSSTAELFVCSGIENQKAKG